MKHRRKREREKGGREAITTVKCTSDLIILHIELERLVQHQIKTDKTFLFLEDKPQHNSDIMNREQFSLLKQNDAFFRCCKNAQIANV